MTELKLTPPRLNLLRAAGENRIHHQRSPRLGKTGTWLKRPGDTELQVTGRVDEALAAGWLVLGPASGPSMYARRPVLLTEKGRQILLAWPSGVVMPAPDNGRTERADAELRAAKQAADKLDQVAKLLAVASQEVSHCADRVERGDLGDDYGSYHLLVKQAYRACVNAGPNMPFPMAFDAAGRADQSRKAALKS